MPSATEQILFHKGLTYLSRSALSLPGSLSTAKNISLEVEGEQTMRHRFTKLNTTAIGSIHSIYRWGNILVVGDTTNLRVMDVTSDSDFTVIGTFANSPWKFRPYKKFLHCVNGTDSVLIDASKNAYPGRVANPATAPTAVPGIAGTPSGHYMAYVSYLITWPNGMTYETGLSSPSADVGVTLEKIEWGSIPLSPYAKYIGTAPTIHRKLYRGPGTGGTIADIYYVATLSDNTTTTYSDNNSDATIQLNDASVVDLYTTLPASHFVEYHHGRCFHTDDTYPWRLCFTEAASGAEDTDNENIMPIATESSNWDDMRTSGFTNVDPQAVVGWGTDLFIAMKHTWLRKRGNAQDTWFYTKTWAKYGIGAQQTVDVCAKPSGIIGLSVGEGSTPVITVFDGSGCQPVSSPLLDTLLETDIALDYIANCRGFCTGFYYFFLYPATGSVTGVPDTVLAINLKRYPDIRAAKWAGLSAVCGCSYDQGTVYYFGCSDGFVRYYNPSSTETVDIDVQTQDMIGGNIQLANREKVLKRLKYNFSANAAMSLQIIIDGTAATWPDGTTVRAVTGTADAVQVLSDIPQNFRGYRFKVRLYATGLTSFTIYSPWEIEYEFTQ